ncbi:MAG: AMP-binding protein [SAR86 cluster bacterium]|jgi:bile acid-coenzyme A ligase|uniref:AMP-binding protein n=1 Tax=SAR86 cluster bacterium TaxID=2030880 RepID=A0A972VYE0_9GAMM|nr:AMP-binding protein [SAR86 cluster bacterium]|tara:strand:- start:6945 stop:8402 length:1458 start_codon:yes stop_codon:yes gene_type:complete
MAELAISRIVAHWAAIQPDRVAIRHEGETITWSELEWETNRLARVYADLGVGQDDFVTIALPNGIEFFKATLATWKVGATPQPVSARLPKFERDQIIEVGAPKLVVGVSDDDQPGIQSLPVGFEPPAAITGEALDERIATSFKAMTSGGSTGRPKLIVSTTPAVWNIDEDRLQTKVQGSMLIPGPLYHNGPFLWGISALFRGNQVTVTTRFDAEQTLGLIESQQVDIVYMVPTMMQRIWNLPAEVRNRYDLSSLEVLWHLAAPCPAWLKQAYIDWLGASVIWELYGGTEGQGGSVITGEEWLLHRGSVGKPNATCEMIIVDESGSELPPGEIGEVFMRPITGPGSTYRYIGAEAKAIEGGYESIGDMGYFDADGYLYLADRQTDMILSGGANIYPAEVEAAIDAYPGVRSSAVIGLPHEDLGNYVYAIVDAPANDVVQEALLAHLRERLVSYKIPRTIEFSPEPLRDDAGKVRRKALRQERMPIT